MVNKHDAEYNRLLTEILNRADGVIRSDRTGVGTYSTFGLQGRWDLSEGFPLLTTKKMAWKPIVSELLWFLEGSDDERRLAHILYGNKYTPDKTTIWTANSIAKYGDTKEEGFQLTGPIYGYIWRNWEDINGYNTDQVYELVEGIKNNPYSRRHILSAWDVPRLPKMCLPPCHVMSQYYVSNNNKLSCHMYQRSCDSFLGLPFNVASYALLTHMLAQVCNLKVGELVISFGDIHVYADHLSQVHEQLSRDSYQAPKLWLNPEITDIDSFKMEDIKILNYESHPAIKAAMAV